MSKSCESWSKSLYLCFPMKTKNSKQIIASPVNQNSNIEEELRKSELKFRLLIDQAPDAIMITDLTGNFFEVNTHFCKMFGYQPDELIGKNASIVIDEGDIKDQPMRFDLLMKGET